MKRKDFSDFKVNGWHKRTKYAWAIALALALGLNTMGAAAIYGMTGEAITRNTAYGVGLLLMVVVSLSVYLFVVIFQPERF